MRFGVHSLPFKYSSESSEKKIVSCNGFHSSASYIANDEQQCIRAATILGYYCVYSKRTKVSSSERSVSVLWYKENIETEIEIEIGK